MQRCNSQHNPSVSIKSAVLNILLFLLLSFLSTMTIAAELRVAVASNFLLPLKQIAKTYERETGDKIIISAGSTGKLYAQIVNGAPYDIFFAANSREPARLENEGQILPGSRFTYARGKLALWYPAERDNKITLAQLLTSAQFSRLSLANPKTAPYGDAAMSYLHKLDVDKKLRGRILRGENVSQAFQYIQSGAADLGFVALSQLKVLGDKLPGRIWVVDENQYAAILQQAVILKSTQQKKAAQRFIEFLRSESGIKMISNFGYGMSSDS